MKYGLIGEKLGHSFSVEIHGKVADYSYELKELSPEALGPFLEKKEFCAINVTIPYKEKVIPYLSGISPAAKLIGAVNTVVNCDGKLCGYNTDYHWVNHSFFHHTFVFSRFFKLYTHSFHGHIQTSGGFPCCHHAD